MRISTMMENVVAGIMGLVLLSFLLGDVRAELAEGQDISKLDGKVIWVIDANNVLVWLGDISMPLRDWDKEDLVVIRCPTRVMVDNKVLRAADWSKNVGTSKPRITGTATYRTKTGNKTWYLVEPNKDK